MIPFLVVLGVLAILAGTVVLSYNRFVAQRASIDATWAGIDVQLQRRHDLIPNLVETVRAYAAHEREVLERVTAARNAAVTADRDPTSGPATQARLEKELTGAVRTLFAVAEGYPDLKASRNFLDLQAQLVETEDRVAASRRLYNIAVQGYNRRVEAVPSNLVAGWFRFTRREYFELTDAAAATTPTVGW